MIFYFYMIDGFSDEKMEWPAGDIVIVLYHGNYNIAHKIFTRISFACIGLVVIHILINASDLEISLKDMGKPFGT